MAAGVREVEKDVSEVVGWIAWRFAHHMLTFMKVNLELDNAGALA
jgi:hypothetical protein